MKFVQCFERFINFYMCNCLGFFFGKIFTKEWDREHKKQILFSLLKIGIIVQAVFLRTPKARPSEDFFEILSL